MATRKEDEDRPWTEASESPRRADWYECWWYGRVVTMYYGRSGCWLLSNEPEQPSYWRECKRKPS